MRLVRERWTVAAGEMALDGRSSGYGMWGARYAAEVEEVANLIGVLGKSVPLRLLCLVWGEQLCAEFCARVIEVDEGQVSRGFKELWELGLLIRRPEGHRWFYQRRKGKLHPVFWQFCRLARTMGMGSLEVRRDQRLVRKMSRGEGAELVADLPWPKRDGR